MSNNTSSIVCKVWTLCIPLRDTGVGYGDYLDQPANLLFLKMAAEYSKPLMQLVFHQKKCPTTANFLTAGNPFAMLW